MHKATGENPFAQLAYDCNACSFAQFAAIKPPSGWSKGPTQVILPAGKLRSVPSFDGVPGTMDFTDEIAGDEFKLIAKVLSGKIVEFGQNGPVVVVDVMRDTLFRFPTGTRVHELTNPKGEVFVLFAHEVESEDFTSPDFQAADALANHPVPGGWTYGTRILKAELVMESKDVASVLSFGGQTSSAWQRR